MIDITATDHMKLTKVVKDSEEINTGAVSNWISTDPDHFLFHNSITVRVQRDGQVDKSPREESCRDGVHRHKQKNVSCR